MENRIQDILGRINSKCAEFDIDPAKINLIAVSKQNPLDKILEAEKFGLKNFGEN